MDKIINTLRILVDWKCNLKCLYCCNEQERFRKDIHPIKLADIQWDKYEFVCISGGEPLLFQDRIKTLAALSKGYNILYSNGLLWNRNVAENLVKWGIKAANIGLHYPNSFDKIIKNVSEVTKGLDISVRFHVWEKYKQITDKHSVNFKYWKLDDCDRDNEDRFVLI